MKSVQGFNESSYSSNYHFPDVSTYGGTTHHCPSHSNGPAPLDAVAPFIFDPSDIADNTPISAPIFPYASSAGNSGSTDSSFFQNFSNGTLGRVGPFIDLMISLLDYLKLTLRGNDQNAHDRTRQIDNLYEGPLGDPEYDGSTNANAYMDFLFWLFGYFRSNDNDDDRSSRDNTGSANNVGGGAQSSGGSTHNDDFGHQNSNHRQIGGNGEVDGGQGSDVEQPQHDGKAAWGSSQDTGGATRQTGSYQDMEGADRLDLRSFTKRTGRNEGPYQTDFRQENIHFNGNGSATIDLAGAHGGELRNDNAPGATKYGTYYYTSQKSISGDGQNLSGFLYGNGRKLEIDFDEGGFHGDQNVQEAGIWFNDQKIAIKKFRAEDYGFKNFTDQPMTYKTDISEGHISVSIKDANGKFQLLTEYSNPEITEKLLRDIDFKQFASAWGVSGKYSGAPAELVVHDMSYEPFS